MIVNALRGRGEKPLKVLVYTMALHFKCSPYDIQKLSYSDFCDYIEIMNYHHVIEQQASTISN